MAATGVFNSWVTALMKASCCSLRRISRTRKAVLTTTPPMIMASSRMPRKSRIPLRQLSRTQPMYSSRMTEMRPAPSAMKNAMDLRRPATTMTTAYRGAAKADTERVFKRSDLRGFSLNQGGGDLRHAHRFCDAQEFEHLDLDPGGVEFVPGQAVPRRCRVGMVVVMPSFAESHEGHPPVVPGIVARGKAAAAPHMRGGIHQPCGVQAEDHAKEDAPEHQRKAANGKQQEGKRKSRNPVIVIQPNVKPVFSQIGSVLRHHPGVIVIARSGEEPAGVSPPGALIGRVRIAGQVGILVMNSMRGDPGNGSAFQGQRAADGEKILEAHRHLVGPVGVQAMVAHADSQAGGHPVEDNRG